MADGHVNKCKECNKLDVRVNRFDKLDYYLEFDRNRHNKEERALKSQVYQQTDRGKEVRAKAGSTYKEKHPKKKVAHYTLGNAIRDGKLIRPSVCETCHTECVPHGHHCDYNKPLEVMWLCEPCHQEWHRNNYPIT